MAAAAANRAATEKKAGGPSKPGWEGPLPSPRHRTTLVWDSYPEGAVHNPDKESRTTNNGLNITAAWAQNLRGDVPKARTVSHKKPFWEPGAGRGVAQSSGGTRGIREGRHASTADLITREDPIGDKRVFRHTSAEIHQTFTNMVCTEKQDVDCSRRRKEIEKQSTNDDKKEAASPGGASTLSTQCSTPRSPGSTWDRMPFTPRKNLQACWEELPAKLPDAEEEPPSPAKVQSG
mmetsp:Transcript_32611/g.73901  ORF Transcript_32611/g.73901 Transcript_32611/m.73901 type:complete len:234 (+) Transcript_32611:73-774(+)